MRWEIVEFQKVPTCSHVIERPSEMRTEMFMLDLDNPSLFWYN